jgi:hypothetical protein
MSSLRRLLLGLCLALTLPAAGIPAPIQDGELGQLDPSRLENGLYRLELQATDQLGRESRSEVVISVEGGLKVGHFGITFEDLQIPLAGLPITLTRSYDSRRAGHRLDFGHGWSLGHQTLRLYESRLPGYGWYLDPRPGPYGLLTDYCIVSQRPNLVTITRPDGQVERFRAKASPECTSGQPITDVTLVFAAQDGTHSRAPASATSETPRTASPASSPRTAAPATTATTPKATSPRSPIPSAISLRQLRRTAASPRGGSKALVGAVAVGWVVRPFALAQVRRTALLGGEGEGFQAGIPMGTVAEGLAGGTSATAPVVGGALGQLDGDGLGGGDLGFSHGRTPLVDWEPRRLTLPPER